MDRLITSLTVLDFLGLLALALAVFCACIFMLFYRDHDDKPHQRIARLAGFAVAAGLPTYLGLRVFWPSLP